MLNKKDITWKLKFDRSDFEKNMTETRRDVEGLNRADLSKIQQSLKRIESNMGGVSKETKDAKKEMKLLSTESIATGGNIAEMFNAAHTGTTILRGLSRTKAPSGTGYVRFGALLSGVFKGITKIAGVAARAIGSVVRFLGPVGASIALVTAAVALLGTKVFNVIPGFGLLRKMVGSLKNALGGLGRFISGTVQFAVQGLQQTLGILGESLKLIGKLALGGVAAFGALGLAFAAFNKRGFELNTGIDDAKASFEVFMRSAVKADAVVAALRARAVMTPFSTEAYIDGATALASKADGDINKLMDYMKVAEQISLLNPAEGVGGAAYALNMALSQDYLSLQDRFNIDRGLINAAKAEGLDSIDVVKKVLGQLNITEKSIERLADTFRGRMTAIKAFIDNIRTSLAEGLFQWISGKMKDMVGWIQKNQQWVMDTAYGVGQYILYYVRLMAQKAAEFAGNLKVAAFQAWEFGKAIGAYMQGVFGNSDFVSKITEVAVSAFDSIWDIAKTLGNLIYDGAMYGLQKIFNAAGKSTLKFVAKYGKFIPGMQGTSITAKHALAKMPEVESNFAQRAEQQIREMVPRVMGSVQAATTNAWQSAKAFTQNDLGLTNALATGRQRAEDFSARQSLFGQGGILQNAYQIGARKRAYEQWQQSQINWQSGKREEAPVIERDEGIDNAAARYNARVTGTRARRQKTNLLQINFNQSVHGVMMY